jgi:hypothetical protein
MHHRKSFHALSFGEEFPLAIGMYEQYVSVSAPAVSSARPVPCATTFTVMLVSV